MSIRGWPLALALLLIAFTPASCEEKKNHDSIAMAVVRYLNSNNGSPR